MTKLKIIYNLLFKYDLIYKWNAPVRTQAEPEEQESEIAPVLETDVVEDLS